MVTLARIAVAVEAAEKAAFGREQACHAAQLNLEAIEQDSCDTQQEAE